MRGEIRASTRLILLCFVWSPPELMESSRIDARKHVCLPTRLGMSQYIHEPIWSIEIITKTNFLSRALETKQFWRSEGVDDVEDILSRELEKYRMK